jgi:hypothetical protein
MPMLIFALAPRFTVTRGLSEAAQQRLMSLGIEFARTEDAAELAIKIIVDPKTNGMSSSKPRTMTG